MCYAIPRSSCRAATDGADAATMMLALDQTPGSESGATEPTNEDAAAAVNGGPPGFTYVCGGFYGDALEKCTTNPPCPSGDVSYSCQ